VGTLVVAFFEFIDWHQDRVQARLRVRMIEAIHDRGDGTPTIIIVNGVPWELKTYMRVMQTALPAPAGEIVEGVSHAIEPFEIERGFTPSEFREMPNTEKVVRLLADAISVYGPNADRIPSHTHPRMVGWGGDQWHTTVGLLKPNYVVTIRGGKRRDGTGGGTYLKPPHKTLASLLGAIRRGEVKVAEVAQVAV